MKRKVPLRSRVRTALLLTAAVASGLLAVWLSCQPAQEQRQTQAQQAALMESIQTGDGLLALEESPALDAGDFYDAGIEAPPEEAVFFLLAEPEAETAQAPAGQPEPIDPGVVSGIGILTIDRLEMQLPVTEGVTQAQLEIAVGHVPQTAAVGETGNAVIAGHRSYAYGEYFNRLGEAVIGDVIGYRSIDGEYMEFTVDEILEIVPGDQTAFAQPEDKAQLTLYTCTPIRTATHRLLVRATRII